MKTVQEIRQHLFRGQFELSHHAFKRMIERDISEIEIKQAGKTAEIIEDYPDDKYLPSCLIGGVTSSGRALHLQVTRIETDHDLIKIITIYQPGEDKWKNLYTRK